jgi:tRNA(Arg) A34 adenosine deaminase TadA
MRIMIRPSHSRRRGRIALSGLALGAILTGSFVLGQWTSRATRARAGESRQTSNREVSQKLWVSAQEIKDRFPAAKHEEFMRKAIANSRTAGVEKRTGGAFGAVIVDRQGRIVSEGSNHVVSNYDPTWHGEMEAIREACARLKALKLDGCILYTSSEPCPMCLATAYWAGLDGIVFGAYATDSKKYGGFDDVFIYEEFAKPIANRNIPEVQVLRDEAVKVWKEYASLPNNVPY